MGFSLAEFLDYAKRFSWHASQESRQPHACGTELFNALVGVHSLIKNTAEGVMEGMEGIEYYQGRSALLVTRKALDFLLIHTAKSTMYVRRSIENKEYTIRDFDRGRVFRKSVLQFCANRKRDQWFGKKESLPYGDGEPTAFRGILVACSGGVKSGEHWFCITDDQVFVERFRGEASSCVAKKVYRMSDTFDCEVFRMLGLQNPWGGEVFPMTLSRFEWSKPDLEAVERVLSIIRQVPRTSGAVDPVADAAEGLFFALRRAMTADAELRDATSVLSGKTKKDFADAIDYIITCRNP